MENIKIHSQNLQTKFKTEILTKTVQMCRQVQIYGNIQIFTDFYENVLESLFTAYLMHLQFIDAALYEYFSSIL